MSLELTPWILPGSETTSALAIGPDGNLWASGGFTLEEQPFSFQPTLSKIEPMGEVTRFNLPADLYDLEIGDLTAGPAGRLWFITSADYGSAEVVIGGMTTTGEVTTYTLPEDDDSFDYEQTDEICAGPDGNLWFTVSGSSWETGETTGSIFRMTPQGEFTEFPLNAQLSDSYDGRLGGITPGPDGNLWFVVTTARQTHHDEEWVIETGQIGRITPDGQIRLFPLPASPVGWRPDYIGTLRPNFQPKDITVGPDGNLWFTASAFYYDEETYQSTEYYRIGRMTPRGAFHLFALPEIDEPEEIVSGPDGHLWFTFHVQGLCSAGAEADHVHPTGCSYPSNLIGRMSPGGTSVLFPSPAVIVEDPEADWSYVTNEYSTAIRDLISGTDGSVFFSTMTDPWEESTPVIVSARVEGVVGGLADGSDSGVKGDGITRVRHPVFEGQAAPRSSVRLFARQEHGALTPIGTGHADTRGDWRIRTRTLPEGTYVILAAERQPGHGNEFSPPTLLDPFSRPDYVEDPETAEYVETTTGLMIDRTPPRISSEWYWGLDPASFEFVLEDEGSGFEDLYGFEEEPPIARVTRGHAGRNLAQSFYGWTDEVPRVLNLTVEFDPGPEPLGTYYVLTFIPGRIHDIAGNPLVVLEPFIGVQEPDTLRARRTGRG